MTIEFTLSPSSKNIDFLTQKINKETPHFGQAHSFTFFIRDKAGEIIAGCNGSVVYGSIYTDQLWVHPDYRRQGFGHQLMEKIHDYGRKMECTLATVATMSFQGACSFYEKMGYGIDFERKGHTGDSSCLYLQKTL